MMIEFRDVAVCYAPDARHPVSALQNVSLQIAAGEWVFLVGPSGAGKSTLLKLVYAGAQASSGQVSVGEEDITHLGAREVPTLRRKLGVIFQDFQLLEQKTVWENVAFALQVIGAPQKRLVRDVPRALETVGLHHKAGARPHELSGGEQQRVAIARAIVNDPSIVLADEPTGNLDPQTAQDIIDVLTRINAGGTTILMATHDRAVVDALQKRVVRLNNGYVVSDVARGVYHPEDIDLRETQRMKDEGGRLKKDGAQSTLSAEHAPATVIQTPFPPRDHASESVAASTNGTVPPAQSTLSEPHEIAAPRETVPVIVTEPRVADVAAEARANEERVEPKRDGGDGPYLDKLRHNRAPLGSPENPLVQFTPPTPARPVHDEP